MNYRVYPPLLLVLLISLFSAEVSAAKNISEKYDGSINSFHWLKQPIEVNHVQFRNAQEKQVELSQFKGKIVLLNLWATWCPPCIKELPALDRMQQRLGNDDFTIVAVSLDDDIKLAGEMYFDSLSIQSLALYTEAIDKLGSDFPVDVVPVSFLIDREGQAIGVLRGYVDWDSADTDALVNRLIAGVSTATLIAEKGQ
jgi:thiol-disulfide isomerase/thioredoxin